MCVLSRFGHLRCWLVSVLVYWYWLYWSRIETLQTHLYGYNTQCAYIYFQLYTSYFMAYYPYIRPLVLSKMCTDHHSYHFICNVHQFSVMHTVCINHFACVELRSIQHKTISCRHLHEVCIVQLCEAGMNVSIQSHLLCF